MCLDAYTKHCTCYDSFNGVLKVFARHTSSLLSGGVQGCFIHYVGYISTCEGERAHRKSKPYMSLHQSPPPLRPQSSHASLTAVLRSKGSQSGRVALRRPLKDHLLQVHLKDLLSLWEGRKVDGDLPVEPSRS